jgi:hypothetical protein
VSLSFRVPPLCVLSALLEKKPRGNVTKMDLRGIWSAGRSVPPSTAIFLTPLLNNVQHEEFCENIFMTVTLQSLVTPAQKTVIMLLIV